MTTSSTRGVITTRRRLVSGASLARVVLSGFATDRHITHLLLNFAVGRPIVRVGIVRGRCGGSWEISTSVVRGDRSVGIRQRAPRVVGRDRFGTRQYTSGVVRGNRRLGAWQGPTTVVRRNGALTGQCSAGMVGGNRSLARELSSPMVWGHRSLARELTASVVRRNWPLAGEGSSALVRGNGPLGEGGRAGIWRHPSNSSGSRPVLVLGLPITFTGLAKFSLLNAFTFVAFPLATDGLLLFPLAADGVLLFASAMLVLLALPTEPYYINVTIDANKKTTNHSRSRSEPRCQDCWKSCIKKDVIDQPMKCNGPIGGT